MQKQPALKNLEKQSVHPRDRLFCLFLAFFAVFEAILLVLVLVRSFSTKTPTALPPVEAETTVVPPNNDDEPAVVPVFSSGVLPAQAHTTSNTATIADIYSEYAVLIDAESGEIVAQKGSEERFEPASMTKVMTLIVACENLTAEDLDRELALTQEMFDYAKGGAYAGSSCFGWDVGDVCTLRDHLYGVGMESASDCVVPVIFSVAGSEAAFVELMNRKAEELGLSDTHFDNAIGHESDNNYTTARDMARIMAYAMQSDLIRDILGRTTYSGTAAGFKQNGDWNPSFPFNYYSTLFRSRMETYKKYAGKDFQLGSATLTGGKTGSFIETSYMVCTAKANDGKEYILVLGAAPRLTNNIPASYATMCDIKTVLDTYIK